MLCEFLTGQANVLTQYELAALDKEDGIGSGNILRSMTELIVLNSFMGAYGLIQISLLMLVLPRVSEQLFPDNRALGLGTLLGLAGSTQLICPIAGLLSDRTMSPLGRRRPFILLGTIVALLALVVLWYLTVYDGSIQYEGDESGALVPAFTTGGRNLFIFSFVLFCCALNICFAAYSGFVPDLVADEQVGESSGIMALMNMFGALTGVLVIGFWQVEPFSFYAIWLIICCGLTLSALQETPLQEIPEKLNFSKIFRVYFEPLQNHDFFWVWASRLAYYMGISVQVFMQYYLRDILNIDEQDIKVQTSLIVVVMLGSASLVAVPCGILSDRIGRLFLLYLSCLLMSITYLGWALSTEMWQIILMSTLFGFANGCFVSVEFAIGCATLPDRKGQAAQALGVWGIAGFLGSTLGPMLDAPLLYILGASSTKNRYSRSGYLALLLVSAIFVLLSALSLTRLKGVER